MDPNATLRMISEPGRINADKREAMANLYNWLARGGFEPEWSRYPLGAKRFRAVYGKL
jgi:hypothetical protein